MYDLVDSGPRNRFVVLGNTPMIAHNCQSTGHDIHVLSQLLVEEAANHYGFDWFPWHMDIHDCFIAAVRTKEALDFAAMVEDEIVPVVNAMIGGLIKLRGSPNVCQTWAEDKDETYNWKSQERYQPSPTRQFADVRKSAVGHISGPEGNEGSLASGRCGGRWSDAYHRKYGSTNGDERQVVTQTTNPIRGGRSDMPERTSGWPSARH